MSRKYNKSSAWFNFQANRPKNKEERELLSYSRYVTQFTERKARLIGKGYLPANTRVLSFNEYLANRTAQRQLGVASGNITRTIVSQQLYYFSREQAYEMLQALQDEGVTNIGGVRLTAENLRTKLGRTALSELNQKLKEKGLDSGYARKKFISYFVFDSE